MAASAQQSTKQISRTKFRMTPGKFLLLNIAAWGGLFGLMLVVAVFSSDKSTLSPRSPELTPDQAIENMNEVFVGHPDRDVLFQVTTKVLQDYDQPLTGNSYERLADIVQTMHDNHVNVSQMDILTCTDEMGSHGIRNLKMEQAIGFCTTSLSIN